MENITKSNSEMAKPNFAILLEKISFILIIIGVVLIPSFVLYTGSLNIGLIKGIIFSTVSFLAVLSWSISKYMTRDLAMPRSMVSYSFIGIILITVISALSSGTINKAFLGFGIEPITAGFLLSFGAFCLLSFTLFSSAKKLSTVWKTLGIMAGLFTVFHFISAFFKFGFLTINSFPLNGVGMWSDVSIIMGVIAFGYAISLQYFRSSLVKKISLYVLFALAFATQLLTGAMYREMWIVVAVLSIVLFIVAFFDHKHSKNSDSHDSSEDSSFRSQSRISIPLLVMVVFSLVFVFFQAKIQNYILNTPNQRIYSPYFLDKEASTFSLTTETAKYVLKNDPMLGPGPGQYMNNFFLGRSVESSNKSTIWGSDYAYATGIIPTIAISTGGLGMLLWILFILFFGGKTVKTVFSSTSSGKKSAVSYISAVAALFLMIMLIIHASGMVVIFLAGLFASIYLASVKAHGKDSDSEYGSGGASVSLVITTLVLVSSLIFFYGEISKASAVKYFSDIPNLLSGDSKNFTLAKEKIIKAEKATGAEEYYQDEVTIRIAEINDITKDKKSLTKEEQDVLIKELQQLTAVGAGLVERDPKNYKNYLINAKIYEVAMFFGAAKYEDVKAFYDKAISLNPLNPGLYYNLAVLQYSSNKKAEAKASVEKSVSIRPDYLDSLMMLYKISEEEKDIEKMKQYNIMMINSAINSVGITNIRPVLFYNAGYLFMQTGNDADALQLFAIALNLDPSYSNARYYASYLLAKSGDFANAIENMKVVIKLNPDIKFLNSNLADLNNGKVFSLDSGAPSTPRMEIEKQAPAPTPAKKTTAPASPKKK